MLVGQQGWGGKAEIGTGVSGVNGGAGAERCCKLCPLPSVPDLGCMSSRQYPVTGCVDGAAQQGWGVHGAALEMGLVGMSSSGSAVRMQHYSHRREHSPAQGTQMAMHLPCSAPGAGKGNSASTKG